MSTLPMSRPGSGFRWLVPIGLFLLAGGIFVLLNNGNEDWIQWFRDNSTCNEHACSRDEAQAIMLGVGIVGVVGGLVMCGIGVWLALRSRDAGPSLPPQETVPVPVDAGPPQPPPMPPSTVEPAEAAQTGFESSYGFPEKQTGTSPTELLADLDAQLAAGTLALDDYQARREKILREL